MMMNRSRLVALLVCTLYICGCIPLIIGASALGGYAISKDAIQGESDNGADLIWESSLDIANKMGTIKVEDEKKGSIAFTIGKNNVNIKVTELTEKATRLRVSCRTKYLLPNITLAQKVFVKIMQKTE